MKVFLCSVKQLKIVYVRHNILPYTDGLCLNSVKTLPFLEGCYWTYDTEVEG